MKKRYFIPFHPLVLSIYPILALIAFNLGEFPLSDGLRPLLISFIGSVILWLLLWGILGDWGKAALIDTMLLVFFYSYGHIYLLIKQVNLGDFIIGRHRYLFPILCLLLLLGIFWVIRTKRDIRQTNSVLNWVAIILMIYPLYQITTFSVRVSSNDSQFDDTDNISVSDDLSEYQKPDIYYIILDAYTRQDTLASMYGFDNSEFIQELTELGFYVAECSQSNYPETYLSLATALNLEYEDTSWNLSEITNIGRINALLTNNRFRRFLTDQGYITVAFESGAWWSEFSDADIYLNFRDAPETLVGNLSSINVISDFEIQLLDTTLVTFLEDIEILAGNVAVDNVRYQNKRARILFTLDQLKYVHNFPGPKFVFAHIISPHRPFIFGPNGEELIPEGEVRDSEEYAKGYIDQVIFINKRMLEVLKSIINGSDIPPIIIVQGDHGPATGYGATDEQRATIVNAYYLPEGGEKILYPNVSPVNTFRIILNLYFDASFELLEDVHYYSIEIDDPSDYPIIPNIGPVCGE